jgi:polyisoprenoid-binding protein YceI
VQAFAGGLFSAFGHNPTFVICDFGGDAQFSPAALESASLMMSVQPASLVVIGDVSEKDKREMQRAIREDVLETSRYPEIIYESSSIAAKPVAENQFQVKINGRLSLHGVTREQTIVAQVTPDGEILRAEGEFSLRQSNYNIKLISVIGGTLKVKDELKFSFDIRTNKS